MIAGAKRASQRAQEHVYKQMARCHIEIPEDMREKVMPTFNCVVQTDQVGTSFGNTSGEVVSEPLMSDADIGEHA